MAGGKAEWHILDSFREAYAFASNSFLGLPESREVSDFKLPVVFNGATHMLQIKRMFCCIGALTCPFTDIQKLPHFPPTPFLFFPIASFCLYKCTNHLFDLSNMSGLPEDGTKECR